MKKFKILVAAIVAFFSGNAMAQTLTANDVNLVPGETANIELSFSSTEKAAAAQFDVKLPQGVTYEGIEKGELVSDYTYVDKAQNLGDNTYRFLVYTTSKDSKTFKSTNGKLATIKVSVPEDAEEGELTGGIITNAKFVDYNAQYVGDVANVNLNINVGQAVVKGDIDGNGVVDVEDINALVRQILKVDEETPAADVTGDSKIDTQDLVSVLNIVFPPATGAKANFANTEIVNELLAKGGTSVILGLNNTSDYRALQFDLTLPEGLEMSDIQLSASASGMQTFSNKIDANTWRVLIAGIDGESSIGANAGNFVSINVNGTTSGDATISNIVFADVNAVGTQFADMAVKVFGGTANGIDGINADTDVDGNKSIYSVGGASRKSLQRGVNIVRDAAGKVTKVIKR